MVNPSTTSSFTEYVYSCPSVKSYLSNLLNAYVLFPVTVVVVGGVVGSPSLNNSMVAVNVLTFLSVIHFFSPLICRYSLTTVSSVGFVSSSSTFAWSFLINFVSAPINGFTLTWNVTVAVPPPATVTSIPVSN